MKFHVGQPVWAIGDKHWCPAIVLDGPREITARMPVSGQIATCIGYRIEVTDGCVNRVGTYRYSCKPEWLRPRDPDQHTPATQELELGRPREIA